MIRATVALMAILWAVAGCTSMGGDAAPPAWRQPGPAAEGPLERHIVPDDGFMADLATYRTTPPGLPATGPLHAA